MAEFTIGDVIRKARVARRWNQTKLGEVAALIQIAPGAARINKSTVSKAERSPYTCQFSTIWRLLIALDVSFAEAERQITPPFSDRRKSPPPRGARDHRRHEPAPIAPAVKKGRQLDRQT